MGDMALPLPAWLARSQTAIKRSETASGAKFKLNRGAVGLVQLHGPARGDDATAASCAFTQPSPLRHHCPLPCNGAVTTPKPDLRLRSAIVLTIGASA